MRDWQQKIHDKFIANDQNRLDRDWNWPAYFFSSHFLNNFTGRATEAFQLIVSSPAMRNVPIGQAMLVTGYPHPGEEDCSSAFVWFLTSTPQAALKSFGIRDRFVVMPLLLDTAIQQSRLLGLDGRVALHADNKGSRQQQDDLIARYKKYGMHQQPRLFGRLLSFGRRMDERYFVHSPVSALAAAKKLDHLR
jgi:hypothetical protein